MIKEKFLKFIISLFIINFRVLSKNSKLEILIRKKSLKSKRSDYNYSKVIYFEKKKYKKDDFIEKINDQMDIDSKKDEEYFKNEIQQLEKKLKPIEDKISKIKNDLEDEKLKNDEKKLKDEKEILDKEKSKINEEKEILENIKKWNNELKIKKFEEIIRQYIFSYNYIIHDNEKEGSYNFDPKIDDEIDLTNVNELEFCYNIKNKRIYDFKFYPFDIDKDRNGYYEEDFKKFTDISFDELNKNLEKDVNKLNEYLNKREDFLKYYEIEEIIIYLKLQYFSEIFSKKGSFKLFHNGKEDDGGDDFDNNKEGEYGFGYFSYLKPIKIKIKRGEKEDIIDCDVHESDRSIDTTLRRGITKFYDIKWNYVDKIIENINGGNYDVEKNQNTMGSKDFFTINFDITLDSNVKTKVEAAEEAEKERLKQLEEQQNYYLKLKEKDNCFSNCCCCCCCSRNN